MLPFYEVVPEIMRYNPIHVFNFPDHLHDDLEIHFMRKGTIIVPIDGVEYAVGDHQFLFTWPRTIHSCRTPKNIEPDGLHLIIKPQMLPLFQRQLSDFVPTLPIFSYNERDPDQRYVVDTMVRIQKTPQSPILCAIAEILLTLFLPHMSLTSRRANIDDNAHMLIDFISKHYAEDLTLDKIAKSTGIEKHMISRIFNGRFSTGFRSYLNSIRMSYALNMLVSSKLSVTYICYECGYNSPRTFNRTFAATYGMPPSEYRERYHRAIASKHKGVNLF